MSNTLWTLDREGFIQHYLVAGPKVTPFFSEEKDPNQLRYEAALRASVAEHLPVSDTENVIAGEKSRLGMAWRFQGGKDCSLINLSGFYPTMQRVAFDAATVLVSPDERRVRVRLWSYAAVDVYCNGKHVGRLDRPRYKPIEKEDMFLDLRPGKNVLYLACETLGVRDTRSVAGLQVLDGREGLAVSIPDEQAAMNANRVLLFLEGMKLTPESLQFPGTAPEGTQWTDYQWSPDFAVTRKPAVWRNLAGARELALAPETQAVTVRVPMGGDYISRQIERTERIVPLQIHPTPSYEENLRLIWERIAAVESLSRGEEFGFPIANMLARRFLGIEDPREPRLMEETLSLIERRVDCADFLVCGLIRFLRNYPVSDAVAARVRQVLTHWRYWMDQDGFDGMCYWSENHCLMFYSSAMLAGEMYPEDFFPLAGRTGQELASWGRKKVLEWLDDVEQYGFEEFHSTVYMCVTFAALINVVDYAEEAISCRAARLTDHMLAMLATHTFKGGIIAPQGRIYRGVLYPFQAGAMALMNLADPAQPYDYGEGWLGFYATSKYRFPGDLKRRMAEPASLSYVSGNARIVLEKHEDWCLTSVQCPREPFTRWKNEAADPDADPSSHSFVKSYNECFHGTTCFEPGTYGYQQHLWYAALDGSAVLFANHPGSSSEEGDLRPGYWHGNGVFPALKQEGALLGLIWRIPDDHPFKYIHLYVPECRFDEFRQTDHWLFLRKGKGFIGYWSSLPMESWNGMNFHCEYRIWGPETAGLCVCAGREVADLDAFMEQCLALAPAYDARTGTLRSQRLTLTWTPGHDRTQFLP